MILSDASHTYAALDGGAPTAIETTLPKGCRLLRLPPHWLSEDHTRALASCSQTLSSLPLDGTEATPIAKYSGALTVLFANRERVVYLESTFLKTVALETGAANTIANDVKNAKMTADGSRVAYVAAQQSNGKLALFSAPAAGGTPVLLSAAFYAPINYGLDKRIGYWLTADGMHVWFVANGPSAYSNVLSRVPIQGGAAIDAGSAQDPVTLEDPTHWSRDGRKVVFNVGPSGTPRVATVDRSDVVDLAVPVNGTVSISNAPVRMAPSGDNVWFRVGNALLAAPATGGPWIELGRFGELAVIGEVGTTATRLLYAASKGAESPELHMVALSGGAPTVLGTLPSFCMGRLNGAPLASGLVADRSKLAFVDAIGTLMLANLNSGTVTTVLPSAAGLGALCAAHFLVSQDAGRIAYNASVGWTVVNVEGKKLAHTTANASTSLSPDAKMLEYHSEAGINIFSIDDGELKYSRRSYVSDDNNVWVDANRIEGGSPETIITLL